MSEDKKKEEASTTAMTTSNSLRLEYMDDCECDSKQKTMYLCSDPQCPNRETRPFYCQKCLYEKHKHMPLLIAIEIDKQEEEWKSLLSTLVEGLPILKEKY